MGSTKNERSELLGPAPTSTHQIEATLYLQQFAEASIGLEQA